MSRIYGHKHYCSGPGCKNPIATCFASQDYDGSPNACTDEDSYRYALCDDCEEERRLEEQDYLAEQEREEEEQS